LAVFALGIFVSPYLKSRVGNPPTDTTSVTEVADQPAASPGVSHLPPAGTPTRIPAGTRALNRKGVMSFTPELERRLQSILNRGADIAIASDGFRDPEQFAEVAHAARNTNVPFMVLRHAVVDQRQSLTAAIHTFKPDVDASAQAELARGQAKADIASAQVAFATGAE
jgi:hypothetical protein